MVSTGGKGDAPPPMQVGAPAASAGERSAGGAPAAPVEVGATGLSGLRRSAVRVFGCPEWRALRLRLAAGALALAAVLPASCGRSQTPPAMDAPNAGGKTDAAPRSSGAAPVRRPAPAPPPVAAPLSGCAWDGEKSVTAFPGPFDRVVDTGVLVLRKLQFPLDTKFSRRAVDSATLVGTNQDERQVRLDIRPLGNQRVEVRVKVGVAGDRSCSEQVLDEIRRQLGRP